MRKRSLHKESVDIQALVDGLMRTIRMGAGSIGKPLTRGQLGSFLAQAINQVGDLISGMDTQELVSLSFETRDKTKAPKLTGGTVFVCHVEGAYFYGRVLDQLQLGTLVEFYDGPEAKRLTFNELHAIEPKAVLHRYLFADSFFNKPNCRIIGNQPVPKNYEYPVFFLLGGALHHPRNKKQGRLQKEQVQKLEPTHTYPGKTVLEHLAKFGLHKVWPETAACRQQVLKLLEKRKT